MLIGHHHAGRSIGQYPEFRNPRFRKELNEILHGYRRVIQGISCILNVLRDPALMQSQLAYHVPHCVSGNSHSRDKISICSVRFESSKRNTGQV